jgi:hypothetical protein
VLKMQINKSDRNDAIGIARIKQTGWFKEVHVKDIDSHSVRAVLASRALSHGEDIELGTAIGRDESPNAATQCCAVICLKPPGFC